MIFTIVEKETSFLVKEETVRKKVFERRGLVTVTHTQKICLNNIILKGIKLKFFHNFIEVVISSYMKN